MRLPLARSEGLVTEELGDELLVYDLDVDHAHALGPTAARVWRRCDGTTRVEAIADELDLSADDVTRALDELDRCALLDALAGANGGMSRRDFGLRVAKVGAAAASVPLIVSITAPTAANALTPCVAIPFSGDCGVCNQGGRPTPCCCCHGEGINSAAPTSCRDDAADCCCTAAGQPSGAHHCTESTGRPVNCNTVTC